MNALSEQSLYSQGFARVSAVSLPVQLADPNANVTKIVEACRICDANGSALAVFPEMSITGHSIGDLVNQNTLLYSVPRAINKILEETAKLAPIVVVGAPLMWKHSIYNCAVIIHGGQILGVTPKTYLDSKTCGSCHYKTLPNSFTTHPAQWDNGLCPFIETQVENSADFHVNDIFPFGTFHVEALDVKGFRLAVEIGEDLLVPVPPSSIAALQGATVIANPCATPSAVGQTHDIKNRVEEHSGATLTAYVRSEAGFGESSNDFSWCGKTLISETGEILNQSSQNHLEHLITNADIDLVSIENLRQSQQKFSENMTRMSTSNPHSPLVKVVLGIQDRNNLKLTRHLNRFPFSPWSIEKFDGNCREAIEIQVAALARRMTSIGSPKLIVGVSGGLDSTHALLVAVKAMKMLNRPTENVLAFTLPGFGTSQRTLVNAKELCETLGVSVEEIDMRPSAMTMLETMGHPSATGEPKYDVVYENVQAGLRTDYLFRLAGQRGGIVLGTGDMSELALGWCTYGVGDHMSHYGVNAGLPKTTIQCLIKWVSKHPWFVLEPQTKRDNQFESSPEERELTKLLNSVLETEISPELIPTHTDVPQQLTQTTTGPYELQDFTLFYHLKYGFSPKRIAYLSSIAWGRKYDDAELLKWLEVFYTRFFHNQFKRTAVPNSPRILQTGSLSPRGEWQMPSDALPNLWLKEIEELKKEYGQKVRN